MRRIIYTIVVFLSIFYLPWWAAGLLCFGGIFLFERFWEAAALVFIYDLLFSYPGAGRLDHQFALTIFMIIAFLFLDSVKTKMLFYK